MFFYSVKKILYLKGTIFFGAYFEKLYLGEKMLATLVVD